MKKLLFILLLFPLLCSAQKIVIDHDDIDLSDIPSNWLDSARANLWIGYGHSSHGSQLTTGMDAIDDYFNNSTYDWSTVANSSSVHVDDTTSLLEGDLGYQDWTEKTRSYLDNNSGCNVVMWSWCGQVDDLAILYSSSLQEHLFDSIDALVTEYPDVKFVIMTGHLEGEGIDGNVNVANDSIRDYCANHSSDNVVLFDFADIEKYSPDADTNFQTYNADDACDYDHPDGHTANWATYWLSQNANSQLDSITDECSSCSHSECLNCTKKGIAAWFLFARLAGWNGSTSSNMLNNMNFDDDSKWEVVEGNWSISDGVASFDDLGSGYLKQDADSMVTAITNSTLYKLSFKIITDNSDDYAYMKICGGGHNPTYKSFSTYYEGYHTLYFTTPSSGNNGDIEFMGSTSGAAFDIDSVTLLQLPARIDDPFYVATNGDDTNDGSIGSPWATFSRAINTAIAGDTVYFRGGVYYKGEHEKWKLNPATEDGSDGERGNPITYMTYPDDMTTNDTTWFYAEDTTYRVGNMAVLDCSQMYIPFPDTAGIEAEPATASPMNVNGISCYADHIVFKDLVIRNVYQKRRYIQTTGFNMAYSNNLRVENCVLYNVSGHGFYYDPYWASDGIDSTIFLNNDAFHCCDSFSTNVYNYRDAASAPQAGTWGNGYFIITVNKINDDTNSYVQFLNNRAWHNADEGVNLSSTGVTYAQGNWSFSNGYYLDYGVYDHRTSGNGWKVNAGDYPLQLDSNDVQYYFYNNIGAFNIDYGYGENNNGRLQRNRRVYNNTMFGNLYYGFQVLNPGVSNRDGLHTNIYKNNLAYDNDEGNLGSHGTTYMWESTTNSWDNPPNPTITDDDFVLVDSTTAVNQMKAPRALDGTLPEITFLHLVSGSDLIDVGTDVGLDYNGTAPDLGYVEFDGGDTVPTASFTGSPLTIYEDSTVTFTDASTNGVTAWDWYFEGADNDSSALQNPTATYSADGTYDVELIVTNAYTTDTLLRENYITVQDLPAAPVANFSASSTTIVTGQSVTFTDLSTNSPTAHAWSFPGGTPDTSNVQNPVITYNTAGTYSVILQASNDGGSDDETRVDYITVSDPPTVSEYKVMVKFR